MRIKAVELAWFRGAADRVSLDLNSRSMVVYGSNGAGKSSFVDGVEYVIRDGKIGHLTHEYSGRRLEKAVLNALRPDDRSAEITIRFEDNSETTTQIAADGNSKTSDSQSVDIRTWEYWRTVLRQDEVGSFIRDTKGDKYSALLPLLGLQQFELAAENLRRLAKSVSDVGKLAEAKLVLKGVKAKRESSFQSDGDQEILKKITKLHAKYCVAETIEDAVPTDPEQLCKDVKAALEARFLRTTTDDRRHIALCAIGELDIKAGVDAVRSSSEKLAGVVEPLIEERLRVLQVTTKFVERLRGNNRVNCPACGQPISADVFQAHVKDEQLRLKEVLAAFELRKAAREALSDSVKTLKANLAKPDVKPWREELLADPLKDAVKYCDEVNADDLRVSCDDAALSTLESNLLALVDRARAASKEAPPDAQALMQDLKVVEAATAVFGAAEVADSVARTEALIAFIVSLEQGLRDEIKLRSQGVINELSTSMKRMWAVLHPDKAIENIHLYLPDDTDKAIDVGLTFYGVEQESPRLTLSESFRNSLGLCIFLAMALREADKDRPLFLDDVVVSMDRGHRGMLVELLESEFAGRQVILLTHDREWFTELRQRLDGRNWSFKVLLPYETPELGIRWSHKTTTFDDARAQLETRPDSAANDARKIMDLECAILAESLRIRLPYQRAEKNDRRMAHEFLVRFVADGKRCFEISTGEAWEKYEEATEGIEDADRLLTAWANRGSHTFDVVRSEASKLIDSCEKALSFFSCDSCGKGVGIADVSRSEWVQCRCGQLRWRYGKG